MKKLGILIFIAAIAIGIVVSNAFSFGRFATGKFFNISISGWRCEKGSGNSIRETRNVDGFTGVEVSGILQAEIVAGKEYSVEIEGDDNLLPLITTRVSGGTLYIESEKRIKPNAPLKIRISAPDIDSLQASGASGITLSGVKNAELSVGASGSSRINLDGASSNVTIDVSGASLVDAENLQSDNSRIDASGASKVTVNVAGEIEVDASGASKVRYVGSPKNIVKSTSGGSRVEQK